MSKKKKGVSAYNAVHHIAEAFRREFRFGKLLNKMAKNWDEWREIVEKNMKGEVRTDQIDKMERYLNFMGWLLTIVIFDNDEPVIKKRPRFKLIKSMLPSNPEGDRSPKDILKALAEGSRMRDLKLYDSEKIALIEVDSRKGGIKPHRISQIIWGVHSELIKLLGDAWTPGDLSEEKVSEAIEAYHSKRENRRKRKAEKKQSDEPVVKDLTGEFVEAEANIADILEAIENKTVKANELQLIGKVRACREHAKGWVKGQLTKRINELS